MQTPWQHEESTIIAHFIAYRLIAFLYFGACMNLKVNYI